MPVYQQCVPAVQHITNIVLGVRVHLAQGRKRWHGIGPSWRYDYKAVVQGQA